MYYALKENVYFVNGEARGCIYDFNSSKLYSLSRLLADEIDLISRGLPCNEQNNTNLKNVLDELCQIGILTLSDNRTVSNIEEIKLPNRSSQFAWIEITNICNLRCRHCYNESDSRCTTTMSIDDYKHVVDCLDQLGVKRVQIIGGEPFAEKKLLKEMLEYTIGKFEFIEIFTNGTLIDGEWFDFLAKNNIRIALSVYSYRPEIHDYVTCYDGSWKKTNSTIQSLREHGISYRICNVLMKGVEIGEKGTDLYELSSEKDIVRMSGRASFSLLTDDLIRKKLITKKSFESPVNKNFVARLISGHNCFRDRLYISADMQIYPCVMERRLTHGAINNEAGFNLDDSIRNLNKDKIAECNLCEYRYACFDCRPNSLSGDCFEKPWYCTYNPREGEWENEDEFVEELKNVGSNKQEQCRM